MKWWKTWRKILGLRVWIFSSTHEAFTGFPLTPKPEPTAYPHFPKPVVLKLFVGCPPTDKKLLVKISTLLFVYFALSPCHPAAPAVALHPPRVANLWVWTTALTCERTLTPCRMFHAVHPCSSRMFVRTKGGSQECIYTPRYPVVFSRKVFSIGT